MSIQKAERKVVRRESAVALADARQLEDAALIELCLARDDMAWREFMRRYEPALRKKVQKVLSHALSQILDSDAVDEVIGDLYVDLLDEDMHKLRYWHEGNEDKRRTTISSWLTMIARGIAIEHIRRGWLRMTSKAEVKERSPECHRDRSRGATWIAVEERNMRDPFKKRRDRKSSDDL